MHFPPFTPTQATLRTVEAQEEQVASLRSAAASLGATANGVQLVVQSQKEELDALQAHYKELLSAGQQEEASMAYTDIQVRGGGCTGACTTWVGHG